MPTIAKRIKHYREIAKMTQQELADKLGVERKCISNWEVGYRDIPSNKIPVVAEALGCTPNNLYGYNT